MRLVIQAAGERMEVPLLLRSDASVRLTTDRTLYHPSEPVRLSVTVRERVRRVAIPGQSVRVWLEDDAGLVVAEERVTGGR